MLQVTFLQKRASLLQEDLDASRSRRLAWLFRLYRNYVHTCQYIVHGEVWACTLYKWAHTLTNSDLVYGRVWITSIAKRFTIHPVSVAMTVSSAENLIFLFFCRPQIEKQQYVQYGLIWGLVKGLDSRQTNKLLTPQRWLRISNRAVSKWIVRNILTLVNSGITQLFIYRSTTGKPPPDHTTGHED